jgi:hypothetical protein
VQANRLLRNKLNIYSDKLLVLLLLLLLLLLFLFLFVFLFLVAVVVVVVVVVVNMTRGIIHKCLLWKPKNENVEGKEVYSYTITHILV